MAESKYENINMMLNIIKEAIKSFVDFVMLLTKEK